MYTKNRIIVNNIINKINTEIIKLKHNTIIDINCNIIDKLFHNSINLDVSNLDFFIDQYIDAAHHTYNHTAFNLLIQLFNDLVSFIKNNNYDILPSQILAFHQHIHNLIFYIYSCDKQIEHIININDLYTIFGNNMPDIIYSLQSRLDDQYYLIDTYKNQLANDIPMYDPNTLLEQIPEAQSVSLFAMPPLAGKTTISSEKMASLFIRNNIIVHDIDKLTYESLIGQMPDGVKNPHWHDVKRRHFNNVLSFIIKMSSSSSYKHICLIHNIEDVDIKYVNQLGCAILIPSFSLIRQHKNTHPERYQFNLSVVDGYRKYANEIGIKTFTYSSYNMLAPILLEISHGKNSIRKLREENDQLLSNRYQKYFNIHIDHPLNHAIMQAARSKDISTLKLLIKTRYPLHNQDLYMRTRVNHSLISEIILQAIAKNLMTYDDLAFICRNVNGHTIQGFSCVILFWLSSDKFSLIMRKLLETGIFSTDISKCIEILKDIHDKIRRSNCVPRIFTDISGIKTDDLMYLQTLVGRFYNELYADDGSVDNRTEYPGEHTLPNINEDYNFTTFDRLLQKHIAHSIVRNIEDPIQKIANLTYEQVHAKLITMSSTGSASTGKQELKHLDLTNSTSKRIWFNELSKEQILELPNRPPELKTTAVIKTETGKLRQLFPSNVHHWLSETFILYFIENSVYRGNDRMPMKDKQSDSVLKNMQRQKMFDDNQFELDIDYKDFNITHTIYTMKQVYRQIKEVYDANVAPGDFEGTNFAGYCSRLITQIMINLDNLQGEAAGNDKGTLDMVRGLWSGWRSTAFFNINLNQIYHDALIESYLDQGIDLGISNDEHMGDDVRSRCKTLNHGLAYIQALQLSGHELQGTKQLLGNFKSEFLRITYYKNMCVGNLSRQISSFVGSDLQAPEVVDTKEFVLGTNEAIHGMIRRGFNVSNAESLRTTILLHFAQNRPSNTKLLEPEWLYVQEIDGGYGATRYGQFPKRYVKPSFKYISDEDDMRIANEIKKIKSTMYNHGLKNVKSELSKKLNTINISEEFSNLAYDNLEEQLAVEVLRSVNSRLFRKKIENEHATYIKNLNMNKLIEIEFKQTFNDDELYNIQNWLSNFEQSTELLISMDALKFIDIEDMYQIVSSTIVGEEGSLDHSLITRIIEKSNESEINALAQLVTTYMDVEYSSYRYLGMLSTYANPIIMQSLIKGNLHTMNNFCGLVPSELIYAFKSIKTLTQNYYLAQLMTLNVNASKYYDIQYSIMREFVNIINKDKNINKYKY